MKKTLGQKISELRRERGMTQENLAEKMGVSPQAVSKWENDISCPDINLISKLADVFGVSADTLLRGEEKKEVYVLPLNEKKDVNKLFLKIRVLDSRDKTKVNVNLPLSVVKLVLSSELSVQLFGDNALKDIDWDGIFSLIDAGVLGKLAEIETGDGTTVVIFVE